MHGSVLPVKSKQRFCNFTIFKFSPQRLSYSHLHRYTFPICTFTCYLRFITRNKTQNNLHLQKYWIPYPFSINKCQIISLREDHYNLMRNIIRLNSGYMNQRRYISYNWSTCNDWPFFFRHCLKCISLIFHTIGWFIYPINFLSFACCISVT